MLSQLIACLAIAWHAGFVQASMDLSGEFFVASSSEHNYTQANEMCEAAGGIMATVHSEEEFLDVQALCKESCVSRSSDDDCGCWMDLSEWADILIDTGVNSTPHVGMYPWAPGQPDGFSNGQQDCVQISSSANWFLDDVECSTTGLGICSSFAADVDPTILMPPLDSSEIESSRRRLSSSNSFFIAGSTQLPYVWAAWKCRQYGGVLASFISSTEFRQAQQVCKSKATSWRSGCWIGLKDTRTEGVWTWEDGSPKSYMMNSYGRPTRRYPWYPGEPNDYRSWFSRSGEDCAHIWQAQSYRVNDMRCSYRQYPLCRRTMRKQYYVTSSKGTFFSKSLDCRRSGGTLASIHSSSEFSQVQSLCKRKCGTSWWSSFWNKRCGCWIGLRDNRRENRFYWEDGSKKDYLLYSSGSPKKGRYPWYPGEPNNYGRGEDCVHVWRAQSYRLNDQSCYDWNNYGICQKNSRAGVAYHFGDYNDITDDPDLDEPISIYATPDDSNDDKPNPDDEPDPEFEPIRNAPAPRNDWLHEVGSQQPNGDDPVHYNYHPFNKMLVWLLAPLVVVLAALHCRYTLRCCAAKSAQQAFLKEVDSAFDVFDEGSDNKMLI